MRAIIPNRLWLGNAGDGRDPEHLLRAGIVAVVSLAMEEPAIVYPRGMISCRFPLMDGEQDIPGILESAIRTLVSLLKNEIPAFVHCSAGMSRSPAVAAAALAVVEGKRPEDQLQRIVSGQPHDVSPLLWKEVLAAWGAIVAGRGDA